MSDRFYEAPAASGSRRSAPAALRNREPIAEVLRDWLPEAGLVLEIASGTGEHVTFFADHFPNLDWQPSDADPGAVESIAAWRQDSGRPNIREPLSIDVAVSDWPIGRADAVLCSNMVHISPWESALGLVAGSARVLRDDGILILYGPWIARGTPTAPSNLQFDAQLKQRDPRWGLREVEVFEAAAAEQGFRLEERREMPANNLMLLFRLTHSAAR